MKFSFRPAAESTPAAAANQSTARSIVAAAVRKLNFIKPEQFPFVTKTGAPYDTGDYESALDKVLDAAGYAELRAEQQRRRDAGDTKQLGIGLASYVEITAADAGEGETGNAE